MAITKIKGNTKLGDSKTQKELLAEQVAAKKGGTTGKAAAKPKAEKVVEKDGDRYGMTLGLKLSDTFIAMLKQNAKDHKTDDELIQWLLKEFPNRENKNILYNMREIRWRYNFGKLTLNEEGQPVPPKTLSEKYDSEGNVFTRKTRTGLTEEEKAEKAEERKAKEVERRAEHDAKVAKYTARINELTEAETARRAEWEEKNGALEVEAPKPKKVVGKKVVKK